MLQLDRRTKVMQNILQKSISNKAVRCHSLLTFTISSCSFGILCKQKISGRKRSIQTQSCYSSKNKKVASHARKFKWVKI
jgi:hypothetical protein